MVDIIAPVTDYIPDSILTTLGDLFKRGAVDTERFGIGASNEVLKVNAAGNDLEYGALASSMFENEYTTFNPVQIIIPEAGIEVLELDLGSVSVGDRLLVNAIIVCTKGGLPGNMDYNIRKKSGTAVIQSMRGRTNLQPTWHQHALDFNRTLVSGIFRVTFAGSLTLHSWGISTGSDSTCPSNQAEMYVNVMK